MPSCGFLLFFVKHHAEDLMSLCSKFKILTKENILFLEKLLSRNAILQCATYIIYFVYIILFTLFAGVFQSLLDDFFTNYAFLFQGDKDTLLRNQTPQ